MQAVGSKGRSARTPWCIASSKCTKPPSHCELATNDCESCFHNPRIAFVSLSTWRSRIDFGRNGISDCV